MILKKQQMLLGFAPNKFKDFPRALREIALCVLLANQAIKKALIHSRQIFFLSSSRMQIDIMISIKISEKRTLY